MTEEDTFNILRRPPLDEMDRLYVEKYLEVKEHSWNISVADEFLKQHGWTYEEFVSKSLNIYDPQY